MCWQAGRVRLEANLVEYRSALSLAKVDNANATAEISTLSKQVMQAESRLAAKDSELQDAYRQLNELQHIRSELERRLTTELSHLSSDQQVRIC